MEPFDPSTVPPESLRPLKRAEYDHLVSTGAFDNERLELLYGRLVAMTPQGHAHAYVVRKLTNVLAQRLAGRAQVQAQQPVAASDESEPEPDLAVVDLGDFLDDHPRAAHLIVEVADSSRDKDLKLKSRLYAEMGVPEYWVVDLTRGEVIVHKDPAGDRFREIRTLGRDANLAPARFPDVVLSVADFLPPAR